MRSFYPQASYFSSLNNQNIRKDCYSYPKSDFNDFLFRNLWNSNNLSNPFANDTYSIFPKMSSQNLPINYVNSNPPIIQQINYPNSFNLSILPQNQEINRETINKCKEGKINDVCNEKRLNLENESSKPKFSEKKKETKKILTFYSDMNFTLIKNGGIREFGAQVDENEIAECFEKKQILICKYCNFEAKGRRSLGGHISKHHPNLSSKYKNTKKTRYSLERVRARTKLLLAKIKYLKHIKGLDYYSSSIQQTLKFNQKEFFDKALMRQIKETITEEMVTNYLSNEIK